MLRLRFALTHAATIFMMIRHCGIQIIPGKSQCSHSKSKANQMVVFPNSTDFDLSISSINHPVPPPCCLVYEKNYFQWCLDSKKSCGQPLRAKEIHHFPCWKGNFVCHEDQQPSTTPTFPTAIRVGHRMAKESLPPRYFGCPLACRGRAEKIAMAGRGLPVNVVSSIHVGKTTINHPFGNGLYHLFMGDLGDGLLMFYPR